MKGHLKLRFMCCWQRFRTWAGCQQGAEGSGRRGRSQKVVIIWRRGWGGGGGTADGVMFT